MVWQLGYKVIHPLNPDWGVGEIVTVGAQQRNLQVRFPGLGGVVRLSTEHAVFRRFIFPPGSQVRIRSEEGLSETLHSIQEAVGVQEADGAEYIVYRTESEELFEERLLEPVSLPAGPAERLIRLDVDKLDSYENRFAGIQLNQERQGNGLGGVLGGRIRLFPHQLFVAQKLIQHLPIRALLADEVGLGKTIEAGMIFSALRMAGRAERVLVLTPSALSVQWIGELFRKFHVVFTLLDQERLDDVLNDHPGMNAFDVHNRVVMGLDYFAEAELGEAALKVEGGWDLVIVDEAHHLQWNEDGGNEAYQAVQKVLPAARSALFLTATPMELDRQEYFALLRLLHPTFFHDESLFSRQLQDMGRANKLIMALGAAEGEVDVPQLDPQDVPAIIEQAFPHSTHLAPFAEMVADGEPGAVEKLTDALAWLHPLGDVVVSNRRARVGGFQPRKLTRIRVGLTPRRQRLYEETAELLRELTAIAPDALLDPVLIQGARILRSSLGMLSSLATDMKALSRLKWAKPLSARMLEISIRAEELLFEPDSKLEALLHMVHGVIDDNEKLLIFVESQAGLLALKERVEARALVRCAVFHEGLSPKEQDLQVALFRNPDGYPILISTESGGEGRNFQFCHRLVHFDLPWEPSRIEQRIGRLDRIGQSSEVESVIFLTTETIEQKAVELLDERVGVFRKTVGGLEPVLEGVGSAIRELTLSYEGDNPDIWDRLGQGVTNRLTKARDAITEGLDHLLHRAGYDPEAGEALVTALPNDFDERLEEFVLEFCERGGIDVHDREQSQVFALELGRYFRLEGLSGVDQGALYVGSFDRETAVEREDIDFFATGHPLIEGIFSYLEESGYGTVALRRYKTNKFKSGLGVQFNFRVTPRAGRLVDVSAFFPPRIAVVPVDLDGTHREDLIPLLTARYSKAERMKAKELRDHQHTLAKAVRLALDKAKSHVQTVFKQAVQEAQETYRAHSAKERLREDAYFTYQLGRIDVLSEEFPDLADILAEEREALKSGRLAREAERLHNLEAFSKGEPILDSVALYLVEPRRKRR